jgi:hypothetical protein
MKGREIRDRRGDAAHLRHSRDALRLPRFNAVQTPDPGFRDAASGLREAMRALPPGTQGVPDNAFSQQPTEEPQFSTQRTAADRYLRSAI